MNADEIGALVAELAPLAGGRCQRIDVIDDGELSIELRIPGRTLRLLVVTRPPLPRVHLVAERPPKRKAPGAFQGLLRKRMEGRPLLAIGAEARTLTIDVAGTRLCARLGAGKQAFELIDLDGSTSPRLTSPIPDSFPISDALAARYGERAAHETHERTRRALLSAIDARGKRARRLLERLEGDARGLERHQDARRVGELLKTALHGRREDGGKAPRSGEVVVTDWSSGEAVEMTVSVDPKLDLRGNVERLFAKAKRAERGLPQIAARRAEAERELEALAAERAVVEQADADALLDRARAAERPDDAITRTGAAAPSGAPAADPLDRWSRRFVALGGLEIRVGKGARENDRLTLSGARPHDLWLHARGTPGAHVILRLSKGQTAPPEALLDAAHLAAHFSSARGAAKVEITYTEARNVRKAKGAPPGQVTVAPERTLLLRIEPERLARLGVGAGA